MKARNKFANDNPAQMNPPPNEDQSAQSTPDLGGSLLERAYHLVFDKPRQADPWSPEDDAAAKHPAASKLCLRCLQPHPPTPQIWFCPNCGAQTGDCVNFMPFLRVLSVGEMLRRNVMGKPEKGFLQKLFLGLFSILLALVAIQVALILFTPPVPDTAIQFSILFALAVWLGPVAYWFWMIRKAKGRPICDDVVPAPDLSDPDEEPQTLPQPSPSPTPKQRAAALALARLFKFCAFAIVALLIAFVIAATFPSASSSTKNTGHWVLQPDGTVRFMEAEPVIIKH